MRISQVFAAVTVLASSMGAMASTTQVTIIDSEPVPIVLNRMSFDSGATYSTRSNFVFEIQSSSAPAGTFAALCLQPFEALNNPGPTTYNVQNSYIVKGNDVAGEFSKLFTASGFKPWADNDIDNVADDMLTALRLAAWDIAIDGSLDLSAGTFRVDGTWGSATAMSAFSMAQSWVGQGSTAMAGDIRFLTNDKYQDLVTAVPEPSTYAMLLAGLAGVGFMARRRQQRSA